MNWSRVNWASMDWVEGLESGFAGTWSNPLAETCPPLARAARRVRMAAVCPCMTFSIFAAILARVALESSQLNRTFYNGWKTAEA